VRPTSAAFEAAIRRSHRRAARVTVLDSDLNVLATLTGEDGYVLSGSVTIDRTRPIRRTMSVSIANPAGEWTPTDQYGLIYWNRLVKLERGVYVGTDTIEWIDLGIFLIDRPIVDVRGAGSTLQLQGRDRMKIVEKSKFASPVTYTAGQRIRDMITDIATDAGFPSSGLDLDDAGKTLQADRVYEAQHERLAAMMDLARDYSLELRVNALGKLEMDLRPDPNTVSTSYRFERGSEAIMLGVTREWSDERAYNHVVVTGEAPDQVPVRAEAMDLNPASPLYVYGPAGDRTYFYTSAMIRTTGDAQAVANALLPEVALEEEAIRLPSVVHPALEAGDAIEIVEPVSKATGRYFIDAITIPLDAGVMDLQSKRLRAFA
jgi:uncharacterized protein DUF5047